MIQSTDPKSNNIVPTYIFEQLTIVQSTAGSSYTKPFIYK